MKELPKHALRSKALGHSKSNDGELQADFGGTRGAEMAVREMVTAEEERRRRILIAEMPPLL